MLPAVVEPSERDAVPRGPLRDRCARVAHAGQAVAAERAAPTKVWFVRQGEPVPVQRTVVGVPGAVRALLAGPTPLERAKGIATAVPARTPLLSLVVRKRIVTVNLGGRFAAGFDRTSLHDRVGQLIRTVRAVPGVEAVRCGSRAASRSGCSRGTTSVARCASRSCLRRARR